MLKGHFEPTFLASILQLLCNEKKTGVLRLLDEHNEVKIYLHDGAIIHAVGSRRAMRIGELLRAKGAITAKQLQRAITLGAEKNQTLGKTLVLEGYITIDQLKRIVREQAEAVIYNVFLWQRGTFEYRDATFNLRGTILTRLNVMNLILEGSRRFDEINEVRKQVPNDAVPLRIAHDGKAQGEVSFSANEWRLISLIDGIRSLRSVIDESLLDDYTAYLLLQRLLQTGLVEPGEMPPMAPKTSGADPSPILEGYGYCMQQVISCLSGKVEQLPYLFLQEPTPTAACLEPAVRAALHAKNVSAWSCALLRTCLPTNGTCLETLIESMARGKPDADRSACSWSELALATMTEEKEGDLVSSLSECLSALLQRVPTLFGCEVTHEVLLRLGDALSHMERLSLPDEEKKRVCSNIKNILVNVELRLKDRSLREAKPIAIFAVLP